MSDQVFYVINPIYGGTRDKGHTNVFNVGEGGVGANEAYSDVVEMDASQLQDYFEGDPLLQNQFGSFDTYMSYMTDLTALVDEQGKWWEVDPEAEKAYNVIAGLNQAMLNGESVDVVQTLQDELGIPAWEAYQYVGDTAALAAGSAAGGSMGITLPDGSTISLGGTGIVPVPQSPLTEAQYFTGSSSGLLNQFMASEGMQALNEQYGLNTQNVSQFMGEDGNVWQAQWTGTGWITNKVKDFDSSIGLGEVVQLVGTAALTMGLGSVLGAAAGLSGIAANTAANAVVQLATTGGIDLKDLAVSAATQGLMDTDFMQSVNSSMTDSIMSALPEGTEIARNIVEDAVSGGLSGLAGGAFEGDVSLDSFLSGIATSVASGALEDAYNEWQTSQDNAEFGDWLAEDEELFGADPFATQGDGLSFIEVADPLQYVEVTAQPINPNLTGEEIYQAQNAAGFDEFGNVVNEDVAFSPPDTSGALTDVMDQNDLLTDYEQVGPPVELAANYDPNTVEGQWLDNLTQDDFIGETTLLSDTAYNNWIGGVYEGDDSFSLIRTPDGYYVLNNQDNSMVKYQGGDQYGQTTYNSLGWLDQHIASNGTLPQGTGQTLVATVDTQSFANAVAEPPVTEQGQTQDTMTDEVSQTQGGGGVTAATGGQPSPTQAETVIDVMSPTPEQTASGSSATPAITIPSVISTGSGAPTIPETAIGGTQGTATTASGGSIVPSPGTGAGGIGTGAGQATGAEAGTDGGAGGGTGGGVGGGVGTGSGGLGGTGSGTGDGLGGSGMLAGGGEFKPYQPALDLFTVPTVAPLMIKTTDYTKELNDLMKRSLFEGIA